MRIFLSWRGLAGAAVLAASAMACDSNDDSIPDLTPPPPEQTTPPTIADLTTGETKSVVGLSSNVEVVIDRRGAPHIYAQNLRDAFRANGYLMARDRFPQMEFIRRSVTGTLTEVLAPVAGPNATLQQDQDALFFGFKRIAAQVYDTLDANDPVRVAVDNYTAGVNDYIDEIQAELARGAEADLSAYIPRGTELFRAVLLSPFFRDWEPSDVMAIARYQTFVLSFAQDDLDRSLAELAASANFPSPQQGIATFLDMIAYAPGRDVVTTDAGGPGPAVAYPARTAPRPVSYNASAVSTSQAARLKTWSKQITRLANIVGGEGRGSNNWVVSGEHTASGAPILANDPHLSLTSPAVWYYVHITARDENVDTEGVGFAGLPSIVLGFNRDLAWGATVTNFDVVDFYQFANTSVDGDGVMTITTAEAQQIAVQPIVEHINIPSSSGGLVVAPVNIYTSGDGNPYGQVAMTYTNPSTGLITYDGAGVPQAYYNPIGVKTINTDPSNELGFFIRLLTSRSVADARNAQSTYFRAGSQNFVFISSAGDIAWQTYSRMPIRPAAARNWNGQTAPNTSAADSFCPTFVFPSASAYTWTGDVVSTDMPSLLNPAKGWIATANQDSIGVNRDGNPCNDGIYVGGDYDPGYREYRIAERLTRLVARGDITVADMQRLQAETKSSLGESTRAAILTSLEHATAGGGGYTLDETRDLVDARTRLQAWSLETPSALDATSSSVIADSIATTIYNVGITRVIALAFGDEASRLGARPPAAQLLDRALAAGTVTESTNGSLGMLTYNAELGDTFLWDNLDTPGVETRDDIIAQAFIDAYAALRSRLGPDVNSWTWGRLHTVRFNALIPVAALDAQSIPSPSDYRFGNGFPRHGDWGAVDVGNFNLWNAADDTRTIGLRDFMWNNGASQRLVVEMLPEGPVAYNAIPGGQSQDPDSNHHADEAMLWTNNEAPKMNYTEGDVASNAELKIVFTPGAAATP
jgi:penicillin amidase